MDPLPYAAPYRNPLTPPPVWPWFVAYCVMMALMYLLLVVGGAALLILAGNMEERIQGGVMGVIGLPLCVAFGMAPFLPRKPWLWVYGLILIALGMTSACCLPASIPLLIFWLKPEVKVWLGRTP